MAERKKRGAPVKYHTQEERREGRRVLQREKRFSVDVGTHNKQKWESLKAHAKVKTNPDFATKLLEWYERSLTSTPGAVGAHAAPIVTSDVSTIAAQQSSAEESGVEPLDITKSSTGDEAVLPTTSTGRRQLRKRKKQHAHSDPAKESDLEVTFISNISGTDAGEVRDPDDLTWQADEDDLWAENKDDYHVYLKDNRISSDMDRAHLGDVEFEVEEGTDHSSDEETSDKDQGTGKKPKSNIFRVTDPDEAVKEQCGVAHVRCLLQLASANIPKTCSVKGCGQEVIAKEKKRGTAVGISWVCSQNHTAYTWWSQPRLRGINLGDIMLATSILLSGNNYEKVGLMCRFANIGCVNKATYHRLQSHYCVPAVDAYWQGVLEATHDKYAKKEVIVQGDGRNDSPGFSAQYLTYTFMDQANNDILALENVDKRQTDKKSPNMEKFGFERGLAKLSSVCTVAEVVTDQHGQITSFLSKNHPNIFHSFDLWHVAKNFVKKLWEAAKKKSNRDLEVWVSSVSSHLWHCARECKGDVEHFMGMWNGVLAHTRGVHEWARGKCTHEPLGERDKKELVAGESAHNALKDIVLNNRFLKHVVPHIVRFRQTSQLEAFPQLILMYASKRFSYTPPVYRCRVELAATDYMMHKDRPLLLDAQGNPRYRAVFSKHSKHYQPVAIKVKKEYRYIPDIQRDILRRRLDDSKSMARPVPLGEEDPRRISKTIHSVERPPLEDIVKSHKSRYEKK